MTKEPVKIMIPLIVASATLIGLSISNDTPLLSNKDTVYMSAFSLGDGVQITDDMVLEVNYPKNQLPENVITDKSDIVGKFLKPDTTIPRNSYFFIDSLSDNSLQGIQSDSALSKLNPNEYAFPLVVDLESSLGNSILPDTFVDLAFRSITTDENGSKKIIFGPIATDVRVISVKDNKAENVFQNALSDKENESLAKLYTFAVTADLLELLNSAALLGEIRPLAKGTKNPLSATAISDNEVVRYIMSNSLYSQQITSNLTLGYSNSLPVTEEIITPEADVTDGEKTISKESAEISSPPPNPKINNGKEGGLKPTKPTKTESEKPVKNNDITTQNKQPVVEKNTSDNSQVLGVEEQAIIDLMSENK